jgi:hypothetical protein
MYGLAEIRAMNAEAAERAVSEGVEPYHVDSVDEVDEMPPFPFPHLGDACRSVDESRTRIDTLFVDSSGFGSENEPALTIEAFKAKLRDYLEQHGSVYVAIESAGQFQVWVALWV